ncbi:MAG: hypothetical protein U0Z17_01245 [Bacteroidales bacterium]
MTRRKARPCAENSAAWAMDILPALINLPSRQVIANFTIHNFIGLDAATGELFMESHLIDPAIYRQIRHFTKTVF